MRHSLFGTAALFGYYGGVNMMKKWGDFIILTCITLLLLLQGNLFDSVVYASDEQSGEVTVVIESEAEDMASCEWISAEEFGTYYTDVNSVVKEARAKAKQRINTIVVKYAVKEYITRDDLLAILNMINMHTGVSDEGDYLESSYTSYSANANCTKAYFDFDTQKYNADEVYYCYEITISATYNSTAAEEQALTSKLKTVYSQLGLSSMSAKEKVKAIHDYIKDNVEYDYESLLTKDPLGDYSAHSAYSALVKGKAVCSGYAQLFYRMLLDNGIDCRIVTGQTLSGEEMGNHAWNLLKLDGEYYYTDVTWNDGGNQKYYLYGADSHSDHILDTDSKNELAEAGYKISSDDYYSEQDMQNAKKPGVVYSTHVQSYGWQSKVKNGKISGTVGLSKRLEAITVQLENAPYTGDVEYRTHVQSYGWMNWAKNGAVSGTSGEAKRLEAIQIRLTGNMAKKYDIYYRVQAQTYGWLGWAKNGECAGTAGFAKRLEAIQIVIVEKGTSVSGSVKIDGQTLDKLGGITSSTKQTAGSAYVEKAKNPDIVYRTHVQSFGWQSYVSNGTTSGTIGKAKRLEGIDIKIQNSPYAGGVLYTTHIQSYGWQGNENNPSTWKKDGAMAGTNGQGKRLEAIRINLYGELANHYDVYYRVHAQSYGWLGWAKNGDAAGTAGKAKRLEGIQIVLVEKGKAGPGRAYGGITSNQDKAYIEK